ncbi:hypothetical protein CA600_09910 [Paenibacillus sp. VTT E-133280]|uniref:DUF4430 domain-containing protein n=1 Tax=Paenibacillus sp. VTT E-133280 TaxID=1986222 RepID=UPI000BA049B5|nr:DUF4430 domain-containing protein [Paenibacillus sp. VTT E-133280]OZQ67149.1 hypothetical protein CA600_09910 [Paenibacillus sp. VTT E-133280]
MNKKKWLTAILIIGVLVIAFFWGGNYQKSPNKVASNNVGSQVVESANTASNQNVEVEPTASSDAETTEIAPTATPGETAKPIETVKPTEEVTPTETAGTEVEKPTATPKPDTQAQPTATPKAAKTSVPETKATAKPVTKPDSKVAATEAKQEPKKDKFLTDPVPSGKPKPVEWQNATVDKKKQLTATLSVSAATILDNMNIFNEDKLEVLPADGIIYKAQKVTFYEGESVFDVLLREMKKNKIHMEFSMTPIYNSNYIEGINNLYEFDAGELSGWMYKVNGWFPNYGSSRYVLKDGDVVEWVYTCDLGRDVGGYVATGGAQK